MVLTPELADEARALAVQNALSVVGLDTSSDHVSAYLDLVGPGITKDYVRNPVYSGCGLVAEGLLRRMAVDIPELYRPYIVGTSISRTVKAAQRMGVWVDASKAHPDERPTEGAFLVIGRRMPEESFGGQEHVLTVVSCVHETGEVVSVDGGQWSTWGDAIRRRKRVWVDRRKVRYKDKAWAEKGPPCLLDASGAWRYVLGWVNVDTMDYRPDSMARSEPCPHPAQAS